MKIIFNNEKSLTFFIICIAMLHVSARALNNPRSYDVLPLQLYVTLCKRSRFHKIRANPFSSSGPWPFVAVPYQRLLPPEALLPIFLLQSNIVLFLVE